MGCPVCGQRSTKCWCDEDSYRNALVGAVEQNEALRASRDGMVAVLERLVAEQKFFADESMQHDRMPGNDFYSNRFMIVVQMAQAELKKAKEGKEA